MADKTAVPVPKLVPVTEPLPVHPACAAVPPHAPEDLKRLEASLKANGCRVAVKVWRGQIYDGATRQKLCVKNGIPYNAEHNDDLPEEQVITLAFSLNADRRQLSGQQQTEAAATMADLLSKAAEAKRKAGEATEADKGKSAAAASKATGVPVTSIERQKKVNAKAAPEVREALRAEEVSLFDAATVADLPKPKQVQALKKVRAGQASTMRHAAGVNGAAKKPKQGPTKDASGREIPPRLKPVFADVPKFVAAAARLKAAADAMLSLEGSPGYRAMFAALPEKDRQQISGFLFTWAIRVGSWTPQQLCRDCAGAKASENQEPCKACGGIGWRPTGRKLGDKAQRKADAVQKRMAGKSAAKKKAAGSKAVAKKG